MLTDKPDAPLILVVEDDNNHAELILRSFDDAPEEFCLKVVDTICAAKKVMELRFPSLVLTDYRLPDGNGSELLALAAGSYPVIMMTSHGNERTAVEAIKIGAQDYIVKSPEAFEALPRTVSLALKVSSLIQSRILAEHAVHRAKTDWERTFDAVPDLISIIDLNHTITRVNKAMADRCGSTAEELIGRKCHEVMHGMADPHADCPHERMIRDGVRHYAQVEEKQLDGIFDITVSPLYNTEGQLTACVHVARDITRHKQAEEELRKSEERFKTLSDASFGGIMIHEKGIILDCNKGLSDMTGFTIEELVGMDSPKLLIAPDWLNLVAQNIKNGFEQRYEVEGLRKDGTKYPLVIFGKNIPYKGRTVRVTEFRDITERRRAEEERRQLEDQFHQAQKLESLGVLAGGIAHDFNNILTIIMGHCYMAREDMLSELDYKASFKQIENAGNRAADLCRQMLTYAGKSPTEQTRINLWLLVEDVVKILQAAIKKNVTIELDLKRDVPEIKGDTGQIQQIVMNLVINASEAIGDKNGTIKVVLKKTVVKSDQTETDTFGTVIRVGTYACLEVTDTGSGMDEETQKRIFEPFFTTKFTGRGLGMSAISGIIKSHEGLLQLSSTPGVGTTFKVYFPIREASDYTETTSTATAQFEKSNGTILLVEDEQTLHVIGTALMGALGFSTITASNGREALEIYSKRGSGIDAVLLDLIMPVMGGAETYRELRKISRMVPVIICSGYGIESVEDIIKNDQHAGFVHKPYKPEELRDAMVSVMG